MATKPPNTRRGPACSCPLFGVDRKWLAERRNGAFDPNVWSGRALQEVFVDLVVSGLASMYPVSSWSCFAPDHHGYQRACVLITGQASIGPFGSPVFACAGKTDPPSLLIPLADLGWKLLIALRHRLLLISPSSFVRANGRSFVPACRRRSRRAQGRSRPAVALGLRRAPALPGCALTAPSTARGSSGSDACIVGPRQLEGASFGQHRPGDAGKLVGEHNRQHVVVQPPLGGFDPGFEPVTFPVLDLDQHNPRCLHEQNAQVAIAAPRDFAEDRAVSG